MRSSAISIPHVRYRFICAKAAKAPRRTDEFRLAGDKNIRFFLF